MSSSKGNSNSNKTAHVMNLLRKSNPPAPAQSEASDQPAPAPSEASAAPAAAAPLAPQTPPIITALNADAEVSSQIRAALTEALEEEERAAAQAAAAQPSHPPTPQPESSRAEAAPAEASAHIPAPPPVPEENAPSIQDVVQDAPAQPAPAVSQPPSQEPDSSADDTVLIDVVQHLVEEKADKYIRLFGLCSCKRCKNDVLAITLNHLLPKYVVMSQGEFQLRCDMYANRYDSEITSQLLRACQEVMDHPRH